MTLFRCSTCGLFHDSAVQSPCPESHTAYFLTQMDRYLIISALRRGRPEGPTPDVKRIIDLLKPTPGEVAASIAFAKAMAAQLRGDPGKSGRREGDPQRVMSAKEKAASFVDKLFAMYGEWRMKQVSRAWCLASREERKLRLRTVVALSVELHRIKQVSIFATASGEGAIEAVIEGDWKEAAGRASDLTFEKDPIAKERHGALWEPFILQLRAACAEEESIARLETARDDPS
jgi:hypothetical protein